MKKLSTFELTHFDLLTWNIFKTRSCDFFVRRPCISKFGYPHPLPPFWNFFFYPIFVKLFIVQTSGVQLDELDLFNSLFQIRVCAAGARVDVLTLCFDFKNQAHVNARPKKSSRDKGLGRAQVRNNMPRARSKYRSSRVKTILEHGQNKSRARFQHTSSMVEHD